MKVSLVNNQQTNFGNHGIVAVKGALAHAKSKVPGLAHEIETDSVEIAYKDDKYYILFHQALSDMAKSTWEVLLKSGHAIAQFFDTETSAISKEPQITLNELIRVVDSNIKEVI